MPVPHLPLMQSCLQQSELEVHVCPSGLHVGVGATQEPLLQSLLQHSLFFVQLEPFDEHAAEDWQVPSTQSLLQQSVLELQLAPTLAHTGCAHLPLVHAPLQQSLDV